MNRDELDLVARDGDVLVFVEVRTRKKGSLVTGYHSVNREKKKALLRICRGYLASLRKPPMTFRFDIVDIEHDDGVTLAIHHFENVPLFPKHFTAEKPRAPL